MKTSRQSKIIEIIQKYDVETQEELSEYLVKEGFSVTQATVSRDISTTSERIRRYGLSHLPMRY